MKPSLLVGVLALIGAPAFAQSQAAANHGSQAVQYTGAAVGESAQAAVSAAAGSLRLTSKIAAVPVWIVGSGAVSAGGAVSAAGASVASAGESTADAAHALWDFTSGDPSVRPGVDPLIGLPPEPAKAAAPAHDPSPAEMLQQTKR